MPPPLTGIEVAVFLNRLSGAVVTHPLRLHWPDLLQTYLIGGTNDDWLLRHSSYDLQVRWLRGRACVGYGATGTVRFQTSTRRATRALGGRAYAGYGTQTAGRHAQ